MKLSVPFLDIRGKQVEEGGDDVTVADVICSRLLIDTGTAEEKLNYFCIAMKIQKGGEIDLTLAERTIIKTVVGKTGTPLMYGRLCELFDAEEKKEKEQKKRKR